MIVHDSLSDIPYLSGLNGEGIYKTELDNILTIDASKNVVFDDIQSFNEYVRTYLTYRNDVDKGDGNDLDMQLIMALKSNRAMVSRTMEEKNEQHKEIYNLIESLKRDSKYQGIVTKIISGIMIKRTTYSSGGCTRLQLVSLLTLASTKYEYHIILNMIKVNSIVEQKLS